MRHHYSLLLALAACFAVAQLPVARAQSGQATVSTTTTTQAAPAQNNNNSAATPSSQSGATDQTAQPATDQTNNAGSNTAQDQGTTTTTTEQNNVVTTQQTTATPAGATTSTTTAIGYQPPVSEHNPAGKLDLSAQLTGVFTRNANGALINHLATNSAGVLVGARYHLDGWNALELNYGFTRNSQKYLSGGTTSAPATNTDIASNMHEFSANYVFNAPLWGVEPFLLGGGGYLLFDPTNAARVSIPGVRNQGRGMFDYGGGVDFRIAQGVGFRAEFRELNFKVPYFGLAPLNINKWTHVAQPSVGLIFTF
jgi:hypothetical protein